MSLLIDISLLMFSQNKYLEEVLFRYILSNHSTENLQHTAGKHESSYSSALKEKKILKKISM